jgi:CrcB protein
MYVLVCLGGGLGAAGRFMLDGTIRGRWSRVFPLATVAINVSGAFLIGLLTGALAYGLAATGFCGGYTTFSTAMVETVRLVQLKDYRRAAVNAFGTLVIAVAAAAAGVGIAALVW